MPRTFTLGIWALALTALAAEPLLAQGQPIKSGVRGRVVVAAELASATNWPLGEELAAEVRAGARVRRPTGRGPQTALLAPAPPLTVVLEGVRSRDEPTTATLRLAGLRFAPGETVIAKGSTVKIDNCHSRALTVSVFRGPSLGKVESGASLEATLAPGLHELRVDEFPFARALVRVLDEARILPVAADGSIAATAVEGGDYQLAFYQGAQALQSQPLPIPDRSYVAIDAAVSANGVVTVSLKDGGLQVVAVPQPVAPPPPRAPPPRAPPKPEPKIVKPKPKPKPKPPAVEEIPLEDLEE
jgi:hypothetical protein